MGACFRGEAVSVHEHTKHRTLPNCSFRFLHALFVAIDGNFVSNRKDKLADPEDFPLSKGAGYFVNEDDVKVYEADQGEFKVEVRCSLSQTQDTC